MAALFRRIRPDNRAVLGLFQGSPMRSIVATVTLPLVASSLIALISAVPSLAADIDAASAIDAVTVYPDAAVVSRVATIDLPAGDSVVVFKDLPLTLDPASLRVSGEGESKIAIGSVDANVAPAAAKTPDSAIEAKLASLHDEREALRSQIDALHAKQAMIVSYSKASPEKLTLDAKPIDVNQWSAAWDAVGAALAKLGEELRPAEARAKALDEEIKALEAERQRPSPTAEPRRMASVALSSSTATHAKIVLSYRIDAAGWVPAYDASLQTNGAKTVSLSRRALLSQKTGEDWRDVALTVSTARAAGSADAPEVQPVKIDFWQPPVPMAAAPAPKAERSMRAPDITANVRVDQAWGAAQLSGVAHNVPMASATETVAQGQGSAYSVEFKVPGRISLAADGAQKSFLLARADAPATVLVKTAPGLDQTAYLEAHVTNDGDAPLLAGEVSLHRDDMFVGRGRIGFVAPGDAVDFGFGADDKIKVTRAPVNRKENEPSWYNQAKIETREFKTTIKNLHDFPVKIQVLDQAPYSENTAITAELLPSTTTPTEKQVGDKRGVMSWTLDLQPGESKDVHLAYRLKWPADRDVTIGGVMNLSSAN
jgi:uncharacterized protein (TIGR02231 family)